jgi:hypothetical protein
LPWLKEPVSLSYCNIWWWLFGDNHQLAAVRDVGQLNILSVLETNTEIIALLQMIPFGAMSPMSNL